MFIQVRVLKGYQEPLWYEASAFPTIAVGNIVRVPLRRHVVPAFVQYTTQLRPAVSFDMRSIVSIEQFPCDHHYQSFITKLSAYYFLDQWWFLKRLRTFLLHEQREEYTSPTQSFTIHTNVTLTQEQQAIYDEVALHITKPSYFPAVLHGVTGSGKTEVYCALLQHAIQQGKSVILLLPEVSLAVNFTILLKKRYQEAISIYSFHSATSSQEKKDLWAALLLNKPVLIIGVHLPIMLPIPNLGLILVDEEHEVGYQEKKYPRINSKEAALLRAQLVGIPIILGSATPSVASLYNVSARGWKLFQIKKRYAGSFPNIQIVNLTHKSAQKKRSSFWISHELEAALQNRLNKREQSIIFINRRGFSFFVQCPSCASSITCDHCSVALTVHEGNILLCHYCGLQMAVPLQCPTCKQHEKYLIQKGIGTQQIVTILQRMFPQARIVRADLDTTINKKKWQQIIQDITQNNVDIIVGTQTITKGYHFPNVTLVGVVWADLNIHFPRYNATEVALQQLIQVAGRAGRQHTNSQVIMQTLSNHSLFDYLNELDYLRFCQIETATRIQVGYPPAVRLIELIVRHAEEIVVEREAQQLTHFLQAHNCDQKVRILGPAKPLVHKVKNIYSRAIYIKGNQLQTVYEVVKLIEKNNYQSLILITPNPLT
jgi:primosomal protein N' (replication factor Y)